MGISGSARTQAGTLAPAPRKRVFISYRHVQPDQGLALQLARALQTEHEVFIDAGLAGGQNWADIIDQELTSADFLIALISEAAAESPMVLAEIEPAHLSEQAHGRPVIIPVRVAYSAGYSYRLRAYLSRFQALDWQRESDTPELLRRLRATLAGSRLPRHVGCARSWWGRIGAGFGSVEALTGRERREMLKRVRAFWVDGLLEHSLQNVVRLELGFAPRPDAVATALPVSSAQPAPLSLHPPRGEGRLAIFDHYQGALLILGAPGAGKSTWLLELARDLLDRAARDPDHPIPVIFNLSSWAVRRRPLAEWMAEELNRLYDAPRRQARKWIAADKVLPLLDGLDEVAPDFREACVARINDFRKQHWLLPVVTCSRDIEYESLGERLRLFGAVRIRSLTRDQIEKSLEAAGDSLRGLVEALGTDPALWEFLDTPLMLSVTVLAYRDRPVDAAGGASDEGPVAACAAADNPAADRRERIFRAYVHRMFEERAGTKAPASEQETLATLGFLATMSEQHGQTEFFATDLQPTWLPSPAERWRYAFLSRQCMCVAIVILMFTAVELTPGVAERGTSHPRWAWFDSAWGDLISILLLCVPGAALRAVFIHRRLRQALPGSGSRIAGWLSRVAWLAAGAAAGAFFGWIQMILQRAPTDESTGTLLVFVIGFGLLCSGGRNAAQDVKRPEPLTWSWRHAVRGLRWALAGPLFLAVAMSDSFGTIHVFFHMIWRELLLLAGAVSLAIGLVAAVWSGMRRGLGESKSRPPLGMALAARNAVFTAIAAGSAAVVVMLGLMALENAVRSGWIRSARSFASPAVSSTDVLQVSLMVGITMALAALVWNGSLDVMKHYTLRRLLHRERHLPWRLGDILDYSVRLLFLRRIGGGYLFVHRFLREHIARRMEQPGDSAASAGRTE